MILYADYLFYQNNYKGTKLSEDEFNRAVIPATYHVRNLTSGRADNNLQLDEVKLATCAVCDLVGRLDGGRTIKSENTDGYSVTYVDYTESDKMQEIKSAVVLYLGDTGLMYLGV